MAIASTIRKVTSSTSNSFTKKKKAGESEDEEEVDLSRPLVHGAVRFPGSRHRPAKWSQISHEASMYDTMQLLTRTWGLRAPSSLISIIGCRSTSDDLFGPGLKRAATTTNAWILTDGVHEGIGGLVGPHVQGSTSVPCIGIHSWPLVSFHEVLQPNRTTMINRIRRNAGIAGREARSDAARTSTVSRESSISRADTRTSSGGPQIPSRSPSVNLIPSSPPPSPPPSPPGFDGRDSRSCSGSDFRTSQAFRPRRPSVSEMVHG